MTDTLTAPVGTDWVQAATRVRQELARTAAARDRAAGTPTFEVGLLKDAGLLGIFIPEGLGGGGADFSQVAAVVGEIAKADSSVAHILLYHYFGSIAGTRGENGLLGPRRAQRIARENLFHGTVAQAAYPPLISADPTADGFVLNGSKPFTSGAAVGDVLLAWVQFGPGSVLDGADVSGQLATVHIEGGAPGVGFAGDWDNVGQRLTVSGTTTLTDVEISADAVIGYGYGVTPPQPADHLDVLYMYAGFAAIFTGLARGAFEEAADYTRARSRPWVETKHTSAQEDPLILERFGHLWTLLQSAEALTSRAVAAVDEARARGAGLTWEQRAEDVTLINAARAHAGETAITLASRIFEVTGARSTAASVGLDRFWRNARTLTLHDPLHHKQTQIGDFVLNGVAPAPGFYS